jgi:8-oxo-dGTP diphosphatase
VSTSVDAPVDTSSDTKAIPRRVNAIDWKIWRPTDRATLVFVIRGGEILLIRKKRGLGAGKINGPGGRIDPGESTRHCAIRELREELGTTPCALREVGELRFQFVDGYGIHVWVFTAEACVGTPRESPEAIPLWTPLEQIPYDQMWADDRLWIPIMLRGDRFEGCFIFDGDHMVDYALNISK